MFHRSQIALQLRRGEKIWLARLNAEEGKNPALGRKLIEAYIEMARMRRLECLKQYLANRKARPKQKTFSEVYDENARRRRQYDE